MSGYTVNVTDETRRDIITLARRCGRVKSIVATQSTKQIFERNSEQCETWSQIRIEFATGDEENIFFDAHARMIE